MTSPLHRTPGTSLRSSRAVGPAIGAVLFLVAASGCARPGDAASPEAAPPMRVQPTYVALGSTAAASTSPVATGSPGSGAVPGAASPSGTASLATGLGVHASGPSVTGTPGTPALASATVSPTSGTGSSEVPVTGTPAAAVPGAPIPARDRRRPTPPPEAGASTVEGAAAFVLHYFAAVDYGFQTGDVQPLLATSTSECVTTADFARSIRDLAAEGARPLGPTQSARVAGSSMPRPGTAVVKVAYSTHPVEVLRPDRNRYQVAATAPRSLIATLVWVGSGWRMQTLAG